MPERIQLKRTKGWRLPDGAVVVSRPSRWGNHIRITPERSEHHGRVMYRVHGSPLDISGGPAYALLDTARHFAMQFFKWDLLNGRVALKVGDVRRELVGKDLACWCPLGSPCHASVLLDIATWEADVDG